MGQRLAAECAEYLVTVALRDDVISRFSPQALERLQKELRNLDLEAAKQVLYCQKPPLYKVSCTLRAQLSHPIIYSRRVLGHDFP